ncbi:hypothetical protein CAPTEDRAFT_227533 [Capitella teleta]|uniref:Uncharacterized protein n=1 Tax=Capitella teleta TaxID=283909 RepID=R7URZ3_CAPTE|nr:hypothetical protein CAPTEDRAFT_227533 [Capitella teleta]|eukprot:ELU06161.1 hypothetical protein CAPTEDRAFT_227533 [Capitella teleta]
MSEIVENGQQQIGPLVDGGEQPLTNGAGNHSTQHDLPAEREVEMIPEVSKQLILVNMTEAVTPKVGFQSEVARITLSPQSGGGGGGGGGEGTDPAADEQHEGAAPEELHLSSSEVVLVKPPSDLIDFDLEAAEETAAVLPRGDQHVTVESKQAINEDVVVPAVTTQEEVVSEVTIDPVEKAPVSTSSMVNAAVQPEEVLPVRSSCRHLFPMSLWLKWLPRKPLLLLEKILPRSLRRITLKVIAPIADSTPGPVNCNIHLHARVMHYGNIYMYMHERLIIPEKDCVYMFICIMTRGVYAELTARSILSVKHILCEKRSYYGTSCYCFLDFRLRRIINVASKNQIVLASEFVEEEINQRVNITTKENKTNMADVLPAVNWVNFLYFVFAILTAAFLKCVFIDDISLFWILALLSVASVVIFWKLDA